MIVSILLTVISPYTALLPAIYMTYKVLSGKTIIHKNPWNIGLLLLFLWSLIAGILNHSLISSLLSLFILIYFCLGVYLQNHFAEEDKIDIICKYLVIFSIFAALFGIIEKIIFSFINIPIWNYLLGLSTTSNVNHRMYSTFGNPNVTGNWFAIMILIGIYLSGNENKYNKLFYQLSVALFVLALFLTGSRGANIGLLTGLFTYFCLKKNKENKVYIILLFLIIAIVAFVPPEILNLNYLLGHDINNSFSSRYKIWYGCIKMFKLKPIAGWGLAGIYNNGLPYINFHSRVFHAQNLWISILTTLGIIGLSIYVYIKIYLYKGLIMLNKKNCRLVPLLAGIEGLIVGHGLVDFTIMTPQSGILFISCSALISSLIMKYSSTIISSPTCVKPRKKLYKTG